MKVKKNTARLLLPLVGLLLLGGCSSNPAATTGAQITEGAVPDDGLLATSEFHYLANVNKVAKIIDFDAALSSVPWAFIEPYPETTTQFVAFVSASTSVDGQCLTHAGIAVEETNSTVTIAALSLPSEQDGVCESEVDGGHFQLQQPVGDRTVLHAALAEEWSDVKSPISTQPAVAEPTSSAAPIRPYEGEANCENLIKDETAEVLEKSGATLSPTYEQKIADAPDQEIHAFLEYGGIVCAWVSGPHPEIVYAYGRISAPQADIQRKAFEERGYSRIESKQGEAWQETDEGYGTFILSDGFWVFAYDSDGGVDLADEVAGVATRL